MKSLFNDSMPHALRSFNNTCALRPTTITVLITEEKHKNNKQHKFTKITQEKPTALTDNIVLDTTTNFVTWLSCF